MITPPVCLASYAAAAMAETDPIQLGWTATRLAVIALTIPFLFVLEPSLLLMGNPAKLFLVIPTAICGCYFLAAGLTGYMFRNLSVWSRFLSIFGGGALLIPLGVGLNIGWISDIIGALIVIPLFIWDLSGRKKLLLQEVTVIGSL